MKKRIWIGSIVALTLVWATPGLAATKTAKPGKGVNEATCFSCHEEAAVKMGISRPTFTRLYEEARNRLAEALIEGKSFIIEGGEVSFSSVSFRCSDCKHSFQTSKEEAETTTACPKCKSTQIVFDRSPVNFTHHRIGVSVSQGLPVHLQPDVFCIRGHGEHRF